MILKIEQIREKHIKIQCDFHRKPIGWEGLRATSVRKKYRRKISIFIRSKFEVKKQKEHLKIFNPINSYEFHSRKAEASYSTFLLCLHTTLLSRILTRTFLGVSQKSTDLWRRKRNRAFSRNSSKRSTYFYWLQLHNVLGSRPHHVRHIFIFNGDGKNYTA